MALRLFSRIPLRALTWTPKVRLVRGQPLTSRGNYAPRTNFKTVIASFVTNTLKKTRKQQMNYMPMISNRRKNLLKIPVIKVTTLNDLLWQALVKLRIENQPWAIRAKCAIHEIRNLFLNGENSIMLIHLDCEKHLSDHCQ